MLWTVVCWGGSIKKRDEMCLDKLVRRAGSVVGVERDSVVKVAERRTLHKLLSIIDDEGHPLHTIIMDKRSKFSGRLLSQSCSTDRLMRSFQLSEAVPSRTMLVERVLVSFFAVKVLLSLSWCTAAQQHGPFVYTRDQLIALKPAGMDTRTANIPEELWRRTHRGCRGGTKQRTGKSRAKRRRLMEKKGYKPRLPTLIMGNVRSLANKMDELAALAMSQKEYRQCSLMCFSETWLHQDIPDDNVSITGFQTVRADRDCTESGKRKGGGLAVLVNNRWCSPGHITVKERICCPDIELLAVGLRPYYLPREFSHVVVVAVYIPPSANPTSACDVIHSTIARLQTQHPTAFIAISGDFNHVTMARTLPNFTQYVDCPTREERTLDLLYANVKDAYSCSPLPPLGGSDHNLVNISSKYVPQVKSQPVTTRTVRRWSEETSEVLQDCFETTDWTALYEPHGEDIDGLTECITDYNQTSVWTPLSQPGLLNVTQTTSRG
ncbi:hypothetical protein NFI96_007435 [Prochilodus magdalenae]|nr:hypothetical protein NFI96_007435 [Prochilodus magdalenae]